MQNNLVRTISVLYRRSQIYLSTALARHNLSPAEYPFIIATIKQDGLSQDELSAVVCVDKSAAARTIRSLEDKGYVRRERDERDRRQNRVYITPAGRAVWPALQRELSRFERLLTGDMDAAGLESACDGLARMEKNILDLTGGREENYGGAGDRHGR